MGDFFSDYQVGDFFDEMFAEPGVARPHYSKLLARFKEMDRDEFERKRALAASTAISASASRNESLIPTIIPPRASHLEP